MNAPQSGFFAVGTTNKASADLLQNEMLSLSPPCKAASWLAPGLANLALPTEFSDYAAVFAAQKPIFLRHVFPAEVFLSPAECQNPQSAAAAVLPLVQAKNPENRPISLQIRREETKLYGRFAAEFAAALSENNILFAAEGQENGETLALSGVLTPSGGIFGVSRLFENISPFPGGMRHFPKESSSLSRAGHKLSEAVEAFGIALPQGRTALDLGAAPGGWSQVLLDSGMAITAVDPAALAPSLSGKVNHFQGLAQDFTANLENLSVPPAFAVMVNDMRLDTAESAKIMVSLAPFLAADGVVIMTFKLPEKGKTAAIRRGFAVMEEAFQRQNARQLFHNRLEITAVFTKKR